MRVSVSLFLLPPLTAVVSVVAALGEAQGAEDATFTSTPTFVAGGLTADEVARRAVGVSADLRARAADSLAADASVRQAAAGYVPRLSGVARYTRLSAVDAVPLGNLVLAPDLGPGAVPAGTGTDAFVVSPVSFPILRNHWIAQATLQIPLSDYLSRIPAAHTAATHSARAAAFTERTGRRTVASQARLAFYQWGRARLQRGVAQQAVAQARAHLGEVTAQKEVGTASEADLLRVTSQVAAAELLLARTQSLCEIAEQRLRISIHDQVGPLELGEDLSTPPPASFGATPVDLQALWEEARERRFERRALDANAGAEHGRARVARASAFPQLVAVGNLASASPNPRVFPQRDKLATIWDASLQLVWTPTDLPATEAVHAEAEARAQALEAARDAFDDALRVEVAEAVSALKEAWVAMTTSTRGLAAAEESYRVRHLLFQNGRATNAEQSDAETDLTRARFEVVNATIDLRTTAVRFAHAIGRDAATDDTDAKR
jgi:outer membrane protein TolC